MPATKTLPVAQEPASVIEESEIKPRSSTKTEPPRLVVDPLHRGDYPTISEAIKAAKPETRILVRSGLYLEGLIIDKPLEIIGEGAPGDVVVQAEGKDVLNFKTTMGRVVNLCLQQSGCGNYYGVDIAQGRLELGGLRHHKSEPRLRCNPRWRRPAPTAQPHT